MYNYTQETYEMKREICNFSKKISNGLNKSQSKFVTDIEYGIARNKSCLISEIARGLDEKIKIKNTIERLCDNLASMKKEQFDIIKNNYYKEMENLFADEPIVIFDDSDIAKRYGIKFEDLDIVVDASSQSKERVNGYHVCEAVALTKKEKQPVSLYSKIYSCTSNGFISMRDYTKKSINAARNILKRKSTMIFDRGYDDVKIIDYVTENDYIIVRLNENRKLLFKGKSKNVHDVALTRKGKMKMTLWFDDGEEHDVYISHTRVVLPANKKEYNLVIVYGLSEEHPMLLLTNRDIKSKDDAIKVVRYYFYRWRVEEYFRSKKQEYDFENMRIRTLNAMNNLNLLLTIHMGHMGKLIEQMDKKLLSIKIIERSKSLRNKIIVWLSQFARGICNILQYARAGIKNLENIKTQEKHKQLTLKL